MRLCCWIKLSLIMAAIIQNRNLSYVLETLPSRQNLQASSYHLRSALHHNLWTRCKINKVEWTHLAFQLRHIHKSELILSDKSRVKLVMIYLSWHSWERLFNTWHGCKTNSASNRNEHQESSWFVKGGRRLRMTTLPPSVSRFSR
jgi:predicted protein tyrosine phosphatase